jgi:class 3 adenylate cyclase
MAGGHALERMQHQRAARNVIDDAFPPHILARLLEGRRVEPEEHAVITAFFADVVGFTTLSAALSAGQVMDMLDRLYTALDSLSAAHGVFKIDTIGDAYLVAANLSGDQVNQGCFILCRVLRGIRAIDASGNHLDVGCLGPSTPSQ